MKKKFFITILCVCLFVTASVMATMAFLTDKDSVANTFTVGKIDIALDEADVDADGKLIVDGQGKPVARVKENQYHLIPGQSYIKDPTMTVKKGSDEAYVRLMVTTNCMKELDVIFAKHGPLELTDVFGGYDGTKWTYIGKKENATANTMTYEFRYHEKVKPESGADKVLEPLFTTLMVPGLITKEDLESIKDLEIRVIGHGIQEATFDTADKAWEAFELQYPDN